MYKNQLQELAQRSCFNLPTYACIREGPDHAPRFRASVKFNGEIFEGPSYCTTLRQAEHAAAEVALNTLSTRGPSRSLAARVLDETGVYKNLLQETAHRAGLKLPVYTTVRSGPGHQPVFTCTVELAGMNFNGEPAKTKKQAEKNAAMAAWSSLRQLPNLDSLSQTAKDAESSEENRALRQRDQQQVMRRAMLLYTENSSFSSSSSSPSHHISQYSKRWRSLDPSPDASSVVCQQHQKQSSFLALPAPSGSKILPPMPLLQQSSTTSQEPSSSRDDDNNKNPPLYASNSKLIPRSHLVPPPLEEHLKDEEEWLSGKSDAKEKAFEKDTTTHSSNSAPLLPPKTTHPTLLLAAANTSSLVTLSRDQKSQQTQFRTMRFGPSRPTNPSIGPAHIANLPAIPFSRLISGGGFHRTPGIAPAVHVRSVIPVCAAPPVRPPVNPKTPVNEEEAPPQTEEEISSACSKLNKLHL